MFLSHSKKELIDKGSSEEKNSGTHFSGLQSITSILWVTCILNFMQMRYLFSQETINFWNSLTL